MSGRTTSSKLLYFPTYKKPRFVFTITLIFPLPLLKIFGKGYGENTFCKKGFPRKTSLIFPVKTSRKYLLAKLT